MKKFFFLKSSTSKGNINAVPSPSADTEVHWENQLGKADYYLESPKRLFGKSQKQASDSPTYSNSPGLQRSRSLSSASFLFDGIGQQNFSSSNDQNRSPNITPHKHHDRSSRRRAQTPDKKSKAKRCEAAAVSYERPCSSGSSRLRHDSSGSSSPCSSNVSSKVIDRFIDGEQLEESSKSKNNSHRNNFGNDDGRLPPRVQYIAPSSPTYGVKEKKSKNNLHRNNFGNDDGRLPPQVQYTAPSSPTYSVKEKNKSHSFREAKDTRLHFSSRNWVEKGFGHESPRKIAKNVIERLSQTHASRRPSSKEFNHQIPITTEDICGGYLNKCPDSKLDVLGQTSYAMDEPYENDVRYSENFSNFEKPNCCFGGSSDGLNSSEGEEDSDVELQRRCKEAEERVLLLSEALEQERFLLDNEFDASSLIQTIRHLTEEKMNLALEVSELLQSRVAERAYTMEELRMAKAEMESLAKKLEKEKHELQSGLEKELDRRSSDWSFKLEKYQSEEQRLRERVRELAEQNVSLQREVSSINEKETENRSIMTHSAEQLKELTVKMEVISDENQDLRQNLSELEEKYKAAIEDLDCIKENFEEKEKECKELHKSIARLVRTCSEQEKTIEGLREGFSEEIEKKQSISMEKNEKQVAKLQREQMRLTGIELALRRELESYRIEVDSLRHENIDLLNRLKGNGNDLDTLTFKLDREMRNRVCCLQNQGLSMLNENIQLSSKLIGFIKSRASKLQETQHGLDGQFVVESDVKVQGFKRRIESLTKSLQTTSTLLHEKSSLLGSKPNKDLDEPTNHSKLSSEEIIRTELKAETLLTNLLREKLYSKELEVEQLQAELAAGVRGNNILRCEVQNAMDNISCLTHRLKDLELQILKKDDNMSRLENELQESTKELNILRGILPKISQERDLMWEEVKQYSEKNMLLNSEINVLRKKIEALDEDVLLKEGQITILKDTLNNSKPFDLLGSPDFTP